MSPTSEPAHEKAKEALERENEKLRAQLERAKAQLERARAEIERLRRSLDAAVRAGKRQATPFSRGSRKKDPKRPGRKRGQGPFRRREAPAQDTVVGPPIDVPVEETVCPDCGGALEDERVDEVSVTDVPVTPKPEAKVYAVEVRRCCGCGRRVRGRHAAVAPDQHGATAHRVGPIAKAMAHTLHYGMGVPVRKTPAVLLELTGIRLTQGAITQDALQRAKGPVGAEYQRLRLSVREAPVVYTDDTSWKVRGEPAQLMVFDTNQETVYQIRPQHRNEEVRELVPADFAGTLVTDRGVSYEAEELSGVNQQKCLAHILKNLKENAAEKSGPALAFSLRLTGLLKEAIALGKKREQYSAKRFSTQVDNLETRVRHHLRPRRLQNPDSQRLLDGIGGQHAKGRLLRFLRTPGVEPTNNRSERALRPAVIQRKVSQCSKTQSGADAFSAFGSIIRTIIKRGEASVGAGLMKHFTSPRGEIPP